MSAVPNQTARLPLAHVRVLATRARRDSERLYQLLEGAGAQVLECPTIAIAPSESFERLDAALDRLDMYQWIAFTSRNAVTAVHERLARRAQNALPDTTRVAAVGPSTARELEQRGLRVDCVPPTASAEELARAMKARGLRGARILLPVGNRARSDLQQELRRAGAEVDTVAVYRTVTAEKHHPAIEALKSGGVDVVALASPSAFHTLLAMLGADMECLWGTALACIGPTTAAAVRKSCFEPAVVASEATLDGLAHAIITYALDGGRRP